MRNKKIISGIAALAFLGFSLVLYAQGVIPENINKSWRFLQAVFASHIYEASPAAKINLHNNTSVTGNIEVTGTVDGRDVSVDGAALDSAASANTPNVIVKRDASGNFSAGTITASLAGNVTGNVSGSSGSCTGNAATATSATSATTATNAANIAITDDTTTNATMYPAWVTANTGNLPAKTSSSKLAFNPSTGLLTASGFSGPLTGNVTGNASGSSGSCTGNSATATKSTNIIGGNATTLLGSIPYQSNVDTTTLLAPNTAASKKYLCMTGDGTNGAAPGWDSISVLPSGVQGDILYHNGSAWVVLNAGASGKYLKTQGAAANPIWDSPAGAGTVTDVSIVTANGVSGTVATSTSTPAITLTLGAITPSTVNGLTFAAQSVGFTVAGGTTSKTLTVPLEASVSGTNTGDDKLKESSGPTTLAVGSISDGQYLKRDGNNLIGATPAGAGDMVLATEQTVTGAKTFNDAKLILAGSTSGTTTLKANATAGTTTITFPAATDIVVCKDTTDTLTNKTLSTGTVLSAATMTLGSDADGDIYYRSSNVLTRLAKGTAGQILIMNSGATAPEWSSGGIASLYIDAGACVAATTNGATSGSVELATNKQMIDYFDFDAATEKYIQFKLAAPGEWDRSTIKAKFYWTNGEASGTGNVIWGVQAVAVSNDDALDASWGTAQEVTDGIIADGDSHLTAATSAMTVGGTPAADDMLLFRIYRKAADASDTYDKKARLLGVAIQYGKQPVTAW